MTDIIISVVCRPVNCFVRWSESYLVLIWLAGFADEVLVLGDLLRLQAQTKEMVPELAAVALNPMNLK